MRTVRQDFINFTQTREPAFREWEVLDESDETLMDWQIELYPIASLQWGDRAAARLLITPEGEDILIVELNDGHIYGLKCPPEVLSSPTTRLLRYYLREILSPQTYITIGEG